MIALDLSKIRTAHERVERIYPAEALGLSGDDVENEFEIVRPVALAFDIDKDKRQFRLAGSLQSTLVLRCSRCLEAFELPVSAEFDLHYQPRVVAQASGETEIQEDDLATAVYDGEEIDLGQLMIEQFYLALPMKPLCSDECKGLCPVCGTNLNRGMCNCHRQWEDPRFAALRAMKKES
ncbi:MAG: DUF177 domain-containing protein [Acidobacteriaceae bacterium]|jgi:uncharacterized protein|nr:DUF177 domain-containing protein [Acidobacteriaceae bacterium]